MTKTRRSLLWGFLLLSIYISCTRTTTICKGDMEGPGIAATICETPYCICNNPYGKIECSCKPRNSSYPQVSDITIRSSGPCSVNQEAQDLIISDCANVTFLENEITKIRSLRSVQVNNVREVVVHRRAFHTNSTAGLRIRFTNTTIADLPSYAFSGRIQHVVFRGVYLGLIHAFAFSSITDTDRLQFVDCNFANVEPQSFKKFTTNEFLIENSRFNVIPSRFIFEVYVQKLFRLDSNSIDIVRSLAIQVTHPTDLSVTSNKIDAIEGEAFKVQARGRVTFQDNAFSSIGDGAFKGISVDRRHDYDEQLHELLFDNNSLGTFSEAVLQFDKSSFHVRLSRMLIDDTCSCDNLISWKDILHPGKKNDRGPVEPHLTEIWCHQESKTEADFDFISGEVFYQDHCKTFIFSIYFFLIIIICTTLGLCIFIIGCIFFIKRRRKWVTVPTSEVKGVKLKKPDTTKGLIEPDGRLYRETEFHVIVEKAEPLDDVVPYRVTRDRSKTMFTRDTPS